VCCVFCVVIALKCLFVYFFFFNFKGRFIVFKFWFSTCGSDHFWVRVCVRLLCMHVPCVHALICFFSQYLMQKLGIPVCFFSQYLMQKLGIPLVYTVRDTSKLMTCMCCLFVSFVLFCLCYELTLLYCPRTSLWGEIYVWLNMLQFRLFCHHYDL
jgi:hypothetical protein